MSPTVALAQQLVRLRSVTPDDGGCQTLIAGRLARLGFDVEPMRHGEVDNLWARRGRGGPLLVFAGHTDVVPTGPEERWRIPPFEGRIDDGMLHGRGAADMKGSLAAMITATERFVARHPDSGGSIGYLVTSDEEGPARDGTRRVVERLTARNEHIDYCLVGEPTSVSRVGDMIKNGRRGSLGGALRVHGRGGHIAYPHLADNPIHRSGALIDRLAALQLDAGDADFPPTSFQISNVHGGTGVGNVIPDYVDIHFNLRFSPLSTPDDIRQAVHGVCDDLGLEYTIEWTLFGIPFSTPRGPLVDAVSAAIREATGVDTELSTSGGTSDGRFIAPTGAQVVELGPVNATIHRVDECVAVEDIERLSAIYEGVLERLLSAH